MERAHAVLVNTRIDRQWPILRGRPCCSFICFVVFVRASSRSQNKLSSFEEHLVLFVGKIALFILCCVGLRTSRQHWESIRRCPQVFSVFRFVLPPPSVALLDLANELKYTRHFCTDSQSVTSASLFSIFEEFLIVRRTS